MKKGMQIPDYAWYHHTGNTWGGVTRKFIDIKSSKKGMKEAQKSLKQAFRIPRKTIKDLKL